MERRSLEAKFGACTIENFRDVILNIEVKWNSNADYTEALVKPKKFNLGWAG